MCPYTLISTSLLRTTAILNGNIIGMVFSQISFSQSSNTISRRNSKENAAVYARNEAAIKHVPIVLSFSSCKLTKSISHRFFSEFNPVINLPAASYKKKCINNLLVELYVYVTKRLSASSKRSCNSCFSVIAAAYFVFRSSRIISICAISFVSCCNVLT